MIVIDTNPSPRKLRQFAGLWLLVFGAFAAVNWYRSGEPTWWLVALAAVVPALGLAIPPLLRWVWIAVSALVWPIGFVLSHLLLAFVYFLVLTPVGLVMRLLRYDPMQRRFDPDAETYWQPRPEHRDRRRYFRQF